jgi:hypothetical protein
LAVQATSLAPADKQVYSGDMLVMKTFHYRLYPTKEQ